MCGGCLALGNEQLIYHISNVLSISNVESVEKVHCCSPLPQITVGNADSWHNMWYGFQLTDMFFNTLNVLSGARQIGGKHNAALVTIDWKPLFRAQNRLQKPPSDP